MTLREIAEKNLAELEDKASKLADQIVKKQGKLNEVYDEIKLLTEALNNEDVSD